MSAPTETKPTLVPIRLFAERHNVTVRTVHRWAELGVVPEPERINGRNYMLAGIEPRRDGKSEAAA